MHLHTFTSRFLHRCLVFRLRTSPLPPLKQRILSFELEDPIARCSSSTFEPLLVRLTSQLFQPNALPHYDLFCSLNKGGQQRSSESWLLTVATVVVASQRRAHVYFSLVDSHGGRIHARKNTFSNSYIRVSRLIWTGGKLGILPFIVLYLLGFDGHLEILF